MKHFNIIFFQFSLLKVLTLIPFSVLFNTAIKNDNIKNSKALKPKKMKLSIKTAKTYVNVIINFTKLSFSIRKKTQ